MRKFSLGIKSLFVGFSYIKKHRDIKKLSLIPFGIDVLLLFVALGLSFSYIPELVAQFIPAATGFWMETFGIIVKIISSLLALSVFFLLLMIVANIICIPFFALLAEKVLLIDNFLPQKKLNTKEWIRFNISMLKVGLLKSVVLLFVAVFCFVLSFIPVLSLLASYVGFIIISFDCTDYALELKELGLKERFEFLKKHLAFYMGSGLVIGLSCFIPGLNFLLLPIFVIGGSQAVVQIIKAEKTI